MDDAALTMVERFGMLEDPPPKGRASWTLQLLANAMQPELVMPSGMSCWTSS